MNTGFPNAIKALRKNGSPLPEFEMDDNRSYLSVTIPDHEYFISENKLSEKEMEYRRRITDILMGSPLSRSELARALGYKSISAKLTRTIYSMISDRTLTEVVIAGKVKLCVSGKSHS